MSKDGDAVPDNYQYEWTPDSESTLPEFLAKYKPSMVQNDGTKPWLWVAKSERPSGEMNVVAAIEEATTYLSEVTERVQNIQTDDSIPIRSNKKKGLKSKKEMREELQNEATQKLKEISVKHGYVSGKWLIFAPPDKVDMMWNSVANSLVSGPLSSTSAYIAKVATSPQNDTPTYSHLICVYMPDAYDQMGVTEVMKVLLRNHGLNLMGVKSNLYTSIGLDSKHASGVSSTAWKNTALMKDSEIKKLKEEYFSELNATKSEGVAAKKAASEATGKAKPKLKKKAGADDPFASADEGDQAEDKKSEKPASSSRPKAKVAPKKKPAAETFASDEEAADEDVSEEVRKAEVKARKSGALKKRKADESDEDSDEVPKKKRGRA